MFILILFWYGNLDLRYRILWHDLGIWSLHPQWEENMDNGHVQVFMDDLDSQHSEVSEVADYDDDDYDKRFILKITPLNELVPDISLEFSSSLQRVWAKVKLFNYDLSLKLPIRTICKHMTSSHMT